MKKKTNRLFEVFQHVTGVKLNEGDLEYSHVTNTEPTPNDQMSSIGSEIGNIGEVAGFDLKGLREAAAKKKEKAVWDKHKEKIDKENAKMPEPIRAVLNNDLPRKA
jgi:hypothetical protein